MVRAEVLHRWVVEVHEHRRYPLVGPPSLQMVLLPDDHLSSPPPRRRRVLRPLQRSPALRRRGVGQGRRLLRLGCVPYPRRPLVTAMRGALAMAAAPLVHHRCHVADQRSPMANETDAHRDPPTGLPHGAVHGDLIAHEALGKQSSSGRDGLSRFCSGNRSSWEAESLGG